MRIDAARRRRPARGRRRRCDERVRARSTARSRRTASVVARDPGSGITLVAARRGRSSRPTTDVDGLYPNDTWSGRDGDLTRRALPRRHARGRARRATRAVRRPTRPSPRSCGGRRRRADRASRPTGTRTVRVPLAPDGGDVPRRLRRSPTTYRRGRPASGDDRASSARTSYASSSRAVRIAFDVSPLSHPRTGIGNYIRGSLAGLAEAAAGTARARRVRADEPERPQADPRGARRASRSRPHGRPAVLARASAWRWSRARPAGGRALARPVRRAPLHATGWCPPQRARASARR